MNINYLINETTQKPGYKDRRFQVWMTEKGDIGIKEQWLGPRGGVNAQWAITVSLEDFNRIVKLVNNNETKI